MLFWILIALLTAAAIMAVLLPLGRPATAGDAKGHARRVYLDQLQELERDKAQGRIGDNEAEAARVEIARRLIATDNDATEIAPGGAGRRSARRATALLALIGIPLLSMAFYLGLGSPNLPGAPLTARLQSSSGDDSVEMLVARVEERLATHPEDGRGWDVIAPVYVRLDRPDDAIRAFQNAIRLLGSTAERQSGLGEALLSAEGGIVTADARAAFEAANQLNPTAVGPRFFLALAAEQEGDFGEAAVGWRTLLAEAPADAPWRGAVSEALARVEPHAGNAAADAKTVAAVQALPPAEQAVAIEGMVGGLAERLKGQPDDVEGWLRLIRSYMVLGRADAAAEAARDALAGVRDSAGRDRVEALIADLGVTPSGEAIP
jgi:cytochrome c-type biogenesis protein CcmH